MTTRRSNVSRSRQPGNMTFLTAAEKLIDYTFIITNNTKKFSKKIRFTITNRIQDLVLDAYRNLHYANEIYPLTHSDADKRFHYQRTALVCFKELDFFIRLSNAKKYIDDREFKYWSALSTEVRSIVAGWHKGDKQRFKF